MRRWIVSLAVLVLCSLGASRASADFLGLDPANWGLPQSWTSPVFHPTQWPFSLFPVPEIATDPNAGTTIGILPVLLFNDGHGQIKQIIAPDIAINTILGATGNFRYLAYPSS